MTLRQPLRQFILVTAVALGAVGVPATALAQQGRPAAFLAPLVAPAPRVSPSTVGKDDLAVKAAMALELWSSYSAVSYTHLTLPTNREV